MPIKEYVHGDGKDYQLWGNVGRLIVDVEVHKKLGTAVSSKEKDIWWVNMTEKSMTTGFASARPMLNKNFHLRYFYSSTDSEMELKTLIMRAVNYAKEHDFKMIYTNQPRNFTLLEQLGFKPIPKEKGNFIKWEMNNLKETS